MQMLIEYFPKWSLKYQKTYLIFERKFWVTSYNLFFFKRLVKKAKYVIPGNWTNFLDKFCKSRGNWNIRKHNFSKKSSKTDKKKKIILKKYYISIIVSQKS